MNTQGVVDFDVSIEHNCELCGAEVEVPFRWNPPGVIQPCPTQIRVQVLDWSAEKQELMDVKLSPDVSCLFVCAECKVEFAAEVLAAVLRLRDKKQNREAEVVN